MSKVNKTIIGLFWSFTDLISKQAIQLIVQIILARLLLPEHFGLIGMITIFMAISTAIVQSGLDQALIREKNLNKADYSTVFYFNLIISLIIYIIIYFFAPIIANFFNESQLISILRVTMCVVVINAFAVIQRVILIRKLDFKTQTKVTFFSSVTSGIFAIILAYLGFGVWSLVAQQVMMQLIATSLLILHNRWTPTMSFDFRLFKKYFYFGYKLLLSGLIDTIYKNIYFVIIGRLFPVVQLGYFTNATKLRDVSSQSVSQAIQKVTYPVLSGMQEDNERLAENYKKLLRTTAFVYFPFMLGIASIAPNLIPFLLGDKWIPSIVYFQLLAIAGLFYPIHAINLNILKVKNRSDLFLRLEIIKKSILTILLVISIVSLNSIEGLIMAAIASSFISLVINTYYSAREINYSFFNQIRDMLPSFLLAGAMSFIVYLSHNVFHIYILGLIFQIFLGVIIYIVGSRILKIDEFSYVLRLIKGIIK